jgi:hypothetical protein
MNRWLRTQKQKYERWVRGGRVDTSEANQTKFDMLEALGVELGTNYVRAERLWESNFEELKKLRISQGHLNTIPDDNPCLLKFVKDQREKYKEYIQSGGEDSDEMNARRITALESIGFKWNKALAQEYARSIYSPQNAAADKWMAGFQLVNNFFQKYGHLEYGEEAEPDDIFNALVKWDKEQRQEYAKTICKKKKSAILTPERIALLQQIGFFVAAEERRWLMFMAWCRHFGEEHGHCMIPSVLPDGFPRLTRLASWAAAQRYEYQQFQKNPESSKLTPEKIRLLTSIGFPWVLPTAPAAGHGQVPTALPTMNNSGQPISESGKRRAAKTSAGGQKEAAFKSSSKAAPTKKRKAPNNNAVASTQASKVAKQTTATQEPSVVVTKEAQSTKTTATQESSVAMKEMAGEKTTATQETPVAVAKQAAAKEKTVATQEPSVAATKEAEREKTTAAMVIVEGDSRVRAATI